MLDDIRLTFFARSSVGIEFAFDQTLRPTVLLDATMLQCFAALPAKLCPESSLVRATSQSRIAILFSSLGF